MQFQQNMNATIQDLKMQMGQLANIVSHLLSTGSSNLPSQKISNQTRNTSPVTLRSGKEKLKPRSTKVDSEPDANSQVPQQEKVPLSFPTRTISARKPESDKELLKMFSKIPKYAKFLKEFCVHKRKKMKGSVEVGGIVSALTKNEDFTTGAQALPKKCRDPIIFSVPCTIGKYTFANAMLDLGASINLANRSIVQPSGVLEDVLIQVNELIFSANFYVLDMEDETSGKGSTLILGRPFLMTARTKIEVHVGTLSMEFGDTLVQFNIFEAMKHPTEDHSLFGIDLIDELVEEYFQLDSHSEDTNNFVEITNLIGCPGSTSKEEVDYDESGEVHNLSVFVDNNNDIADLDFEAELLEVLDQVCKHEISEFSIEAKVQVVETKKLLSAQLATIFTAEYESAKGSQDRERTKVISAKKQRSWLTRMYKCMPRPCWLKKTRSKREPNSFRTTMFRLDPTSELNKELSPTSI
ncbi:hypothetical protein CR513_30538, partial [Mucuna pruriens]